jgi:hypothetical protein
MRRVACALASCAAIAAGLAACDEDPERGRGSAPRATPPTVVTADDLSIPAGCRPGRVARLIHGFFAALERGDRNAADRVAFGIVPGGGWYSMTEGASNGGRHFVARDRQALAGYLAARHRQHERLRLRELVVGYASGLGHVEYRLSRRADDVGTSPASSRVTGKGAVDCASGRIVVWSMATPSHPSPAHARPLCPNRGRSRAAVACVRERRS